MNEKLYTFTEVRNLTGLSLSTLRNYVTKGTCESVKNEIGVACITQSDVDKLIKEWHIGEEIYTIEQVAKMFGIKRNHTVTAYCKQGLIEFGYLPSNVIFITAEEVKRLRKNEKKIKGRKTFAEIVRGKR